MTGRRIFLLSIAAVLVGALGAGPAAAVDDEAEGRRRFKRGQDLYGEKRFLEAAREFEAGYASAPRPLFLLNIGHSYRQAGDFPKAKKAYELLLRLEPDLPQRAEVESFIKTINDALAAGEPSDPDPPPKAPSRPEPSPSPPTRTPNLAAPSRDPREATPEPVLVDRAEPARQVDSAPIWKKPWFWIAAGAVAVVGGTVGVVFALRKPESCPGTVCIRESEAR
jgi:tetratricopeptide (TPR) repeat protein